MADEIRDWLAKFKSLSDQDQCDHAPVMTKSLFHSFKTNRDILVTQQLYDYWRIGNDKMVKESSGLALLGLEKNICTFFFSTTCN